MNKYTELARIFLRLGVTAFGGPAAHIAMFHDEFVKRRQWLTDQHFLDLYGASNLIPGPSSTEMTMHIGYVRAGYPGLLIAGTCFILPAALIVGVLAWLYVQYGTTPAADALLYGIKPVILAVIAQAIWNLGQKAFASRFMATVGAAVFVLYLLRVNEIVLLFGAALLVIIVRNANRLRGIRRGITNVPILLITGSAPLMQAAPLAAAQAFSLGELFLTFFKIGAVIYGSGYVLLAFLRTDFVERLGWLTDKQLLDAIAIGQFTPGPVFTTATFIGYQTGGFVGAVLATIGIFLPGFILVSLTNPLIPKMRQSKVLSALLDGVNAAAIGLMAAVTVELARAAYVDVIAVILSIVAAVLLIHYKVNSTWLIIGGAVVGLARMALG
jgi:chromate transporter